MPLDRRQNAPFLGFLTLSLLLHLLLVFLLPELSLLPSPPSREPVYVEVVPPRPPTAPPRERELDLPAAPDTPRDRPAKRLGPSDRQVARETAPEGEAAEDIRPTRRPSPSPPPPAVATAPATPASPPGTAGPAPSERGIRPAVPSGAPGARPLTRESLMASATQAAQSVAEKQIAEWRQKHRGEVEKGDAVWLDTERDLLFSFFERFRTNIYGVWNYPQPSIERGEQGTCLLRVTVNRDGSLQEVELLESSGFPGLDREAVAAVRKGAPYGKLPATYTGDSLTIFSFFQYRLGKRYLLGG